jgi:nitrite reductase/ring-hydroxylating ferredoxin subunit
MSETRQDWHAVAGMSDLPAGTARAVTLLGEDIALWRGESGSAQAWRNQCPHRGMRLSFGQVRGDRLSCRYHGWQFDAAAQCKFMPAHRKMTPPASVCVPSYGCREAGGLIWIRLEGDGDGDGFDDAAAAGDTQADALFCKSIFVDGSLETLADRLVGAYFLPASRALEAMPGAGFEGEVLDHGRGADESHAVVAWRRRGSEPEEAFSTSYHGMRPARSVIRIVAKTEDEPPEALMLALQAMTERRTGVHLAAQSSGNDETDRQRRLYFGRWARRLRWFLEHPEAPFDGFRPWT